MGMRLIEPSWVCFRSDNGKDEWLSDPNRENSAAKVVVHEPNGSLRSETDSYLSGRTIERDDNKFSEEIKLQCDYASGQLRLTYLGDDKDIRSSVDAARTNNNNCLDVVARVKAKWFGNKRTLDAPHPP